MDSVPLLNLAEIERRVCDIASAQLGIERNRVSPMDRVIEDLRCDSLDLVELHMEIEQTFDVTLPHDRSNSVYKAVFTRSPFRLADLAELVYLQQGTGRPEQDWLRRPRQNPQAVASTSPFTQLGGRWVIPTHGQTPPLFEPLKTSTAFPSYRRRSDGMRCVLIPAARVEIGSDSQDTPVDEYPCHGVEIDAFLIDAEPVSTTAYCRFLNSIGDVRPEILEDWFVLDHEDDRNEHQLIFKPENDWRPIPGTERWPMILVSWFGANAYSLWANGGGWYRYRDDEHRDKESYLPSEAQWEYAARGALPKRFPWGDKSADDLRMRFGQHRRGATYKVETLPLADVNEALGISPFGLHHMAGNVWQWCRDRYDEDFYKTADASKPNALNRTQGMTRSERGGSWVGPASLCRSSFRRGRPALARGRCLGFRCVSPVP